jgi:hypothetical protein
MRPQPVPAVPFARTPGRGRKRSEPRSVPAPPTGQARPASPRGRTYCVVGGARAGSDKSSRHRRRVRPHRHQAAAEGIGAPAPVRRQTDYRAIAKHVVLTHPPAAIYGRGRSRAGRTRVGRRYQGPYRPPTRGAGPALSHSGSAHCRRHDRNENAS